MATSEEYKSAVAKLTPIQQKAVQIRNNINKFEKSALPKYLETIQNTQSKLAGHTKKNYRNIYQGKLKNTKRAANMQLNKFRLNLGMFEKSNKLNNKMIQFHKRYLNKIEKLQAKVNLPFAPIPPTTNVNSVYQKQLQSESAMENLQMNLKKREIERMREEEIKQRLELVRRNFTPEQIELIILEKRIKNLLPPTHKHNNKKLNNELTLSLKLLREGRNNSTIKNSLLKYRTSQLGRKQNQQTQLSEEDNKYLDMVLTTLRENPKLLESELSEADIVMMLKINQLRK